jgi:hypothetical protein
MSQAFVDQITLDCFLNKEVYDKHIKNKKTAEKNKQERKFYKNRIYNLFKNIINHKDPEDLPPDVKYAYNNFLNASIHYFKSKDNNDIIQSEYKDLIIDDVNEIGINESEIEAIKEPENTLESDKLLMRTIKIEEPTLDKYVKIKYTKKEEPFILPKKKEINLEDPILKKKDIEIKK